jgi:hypothetical protein
VTTINLKHSKHEKSFHDNTVQVTLLLVLSLAPMSTETKIYTTVSFFVRVPLYKNTLLINLAEAYSAILGIIFIGKALRDDKNDDKNGIVDCTTSIIFIALIDCCDLSSKSSYASTVFQVWHLLFGSNKRWKTAHISTFGCSCGE